MRILVIDDDKNFRKVLRNELASQGYDADEAQDGLKALALLGKHDYDVVLSDLRMPGLHGIDLLRKIKDMEVAAEVIVLTGNATVPTAVEAMKLGAYDYLTKPFRMEELTALIEKAYEKKELHRENLLLRTQVKRRSEPKRFLTRNPHLLKILENVKKFAASDFPILISGETGVGKELIANAIHDASPRSEGPFVPINCGAIPENMLESELFGYEKGAFTGAVARKLGLIELADHGTLFLDEITELTSPLQGKLLRVIETKSFFRLGGTREVQVDVKFVCATNKDLKNEVENSRFRSDLYFRISTLTLYIPPLRERKEDIPLMVQHTCETSHGFRNKRFSPEALKVLSDYPWPGNVRELQNVVHRILLLSRNEVIEPDELPADVVPEHRAASKHLSEVERAHLLAVLKEVGGHRGKAAKLLGLDPKTLYRKLLSYGVNEWSS